MDVDMHTIKLVLYLLNMVLSLIGILDDGYNSGWLCSFLGWSCAFINEI